jgi:conjugative transfer region lipoprotein (TIGR03751 family)
MAWIDDHHADAAAGPSRHPLRHPLALTAIVIAATLLQACSVAGPKRSPLPQDGPNLVDVYRDHIRTEGVGASIERPSTAPTQSPGQSARAGLQTVSAAAQGDAELTPMALGRAVVDQRFRRLPNPDLILFVYPHLARGKYPVPGYYTVLPMYTQVEYAMPGEAPQATPRSTTPRGTSPVIAATAAPAPAVLSTSPTSAVKPVPGDVLLTSAQQP